MHQNSATLIQGSLDHEQLQTMPPASLDSDTLIESLDCAVVLVDREQCVVRVNVAAETLFNKSRRYLVGRPFSELVAVEGIQQQLAQCLQEHAHCTLREAVLPTGDDDQLVDITLQSIRSNRRHSDGVLIEINSINRISRFMREKNQLERQQSFRLMMRGLAHEIKNPLGGIRGAAQLLDRELSQSDADPDKQELTQILMREADRLTRLVDRVMGSRQQLKLTALNIHEVLEHVVDVVSVMSDSNLTFERQYDPALPEIKVDREQMIQAVLNIVGNAIQAQANKPHAVIGLHTEFDRYVTINAKMFRQILRIRIWDDGDGVDDDIRDILFDPLITSRAEGSGLGLSITQEIVQRHMGVVQLEEWHDKTCFTISLPYASNDPETLNGVGGEHA